MINGCCVWFDLSRAPKEQYRRQLMDMRLLIGGRLTFSADEMAS